MITMLPSNGLLYKQPSANESGAVLSELALSLPLLIIMFVGLFEVGRHMAQVTSLVQTSFNAAYFGAGLQGTNQPAIEQAIRERAYFELYDTFHAREFVGSSINNFHVNYVPAVGAPPGSPNDNIKLSFGGNMRDLLGPINQISLLQNVDFTLPMLVRQASAINYNQFENAGGGLYDRLGNFHSGCTDCLCSSNPCW